MADGLHPPRTAIAAGQLAQLRSLVADLFPANSFYWHKLEAAGVTFDIASLEDFSRRFPFTTKQEIVDDQRRHPPYGTNLTYPLANYTRCHQTSGTSGTLRANYHGQPIAVSDPTTLLFFNTGAVSLPAAGTFGNAGRNTITGPGTSNMNLSLTRNLSFGQNRGMSIQISANNVFNTVQFSTIDAVVNSPTFGQVTGVRAMRRVQVVTRFRF